jgi:hypothetical protein
VATVAVFARLEGIVLATLALVLALSSPPAAQETDYIHGLVGLLYIPEVFGTHECEEKPRRDGREVPLYAARNVRQPYGWIRAELYIPEGNADDCYYVDAKLHLKGDPRPREFPALLFREGEPLVAIVLEARAPWFKVRLDEGSAWVKASRLDKYVPLEDFIREGQTYMASGWDGRLSAAPGRPGRFAPVDPRRRLIGYVEPVDRDAIVWVDVFDRPDRGAPAIGRFHGESPTVAIDERDGKVAVFARRDGWLQVSMDVEEGRRGWIADGPMWRFHGFGDEAQQLAFENGVFGQVSPTVMVPEYRRVRGVLWLHVMILSHTIYESDDPPTVVASGWVPAQDARGAPVVWFHPKD